MKNKCHRKSGGRDSETVATFPPFSHNSRCSILLCTFDLFFFSILICLSFSVTATLGRQGFDIPQMDENTQNNDSEMWNWQSAENYLDDNLDMSKCLWSSVNQNDSSFSFDDEFTPIKACGDLADYGNICEDRSKELEKSGEHSSQVKRRRLHFNSEFLDAPLCNDEISSAHLRLEEKEDSVKEDSSKMSQKLSVYSECTSSSGSEILDQSSDAWLASYFNDAGMHGSSSDLASDVQIDVTEFCQTQCPPKGVSMKQDRTVRSRGNVFKGRKSYIETPTKLASSVVYPFAFIKPCGVLGDMTLKDINQRIRTPPPKLNQSGEDPSSYPTSAFSGKPVVGRTTISTDGGKGTITIMRTKG